MKKSSRDYRVYKRKINALMMPSIRINVILIREMVTEMILQDLSKIFEDKTLNQQPDQSKTSELKQSKPA